MNQQLAATCSARSYAPAANGKIEKQKKKKKKGGG